MLLALMWLWCSLGVALAEPWWSLGVALGWLWCGSVLRSLCLVYGLGVALRWLWVALLGLSAICHLSSAFPQAPSGQTGASRPPSNARRTNTWRWTCHATGSAIVLN